MDTTIVRIPLGLICESMNEVTRIDREMHQVEYQFSLKSLICFPNMAIGEPSLAAN